MSSTIDQDALYQANNDILAHMFNTPERDWVALFANIDTALAGPLLPNWSRAKLCAIRAWDFSCSAFYIAEARRVLDEIFQQDEDGADVKKLRKAMEPVVRMIENVELAVQEQVTYPFVSPRVPANTLGCRHQESEKLRIKKIEDAPDKLVKK